MGSNPLWPTGINLVIEKINNDEVLLNQREENEMFDEVDELAVNTVRTLSIDMIEKAGSGHPGLPLGAAPMAYVLWDKFLNINPKTGKKWINRDRFVLSAGHGSALLYSLLHLSGFKVSIKDLKDFRQWNSKTPGHPESTHTDGVEVTTGPLGQGLGMAVGLAMAECHLAQQFNREGYNVIDHFTYAICGDGDLMEGVSQEAISLAGHLKLGKLVVLYDSNGISLDGPTSRAFTENVGERVKAAGWQYLLVENGNDLTEIYDQIKKARNEEHKPTLIEVKTVIGYGSPNQGTSKVHGAPLGHEGTEYLKESLHWNFDKFEVPEIVKQRFEENIQSKGHQLEEQWHLLFERYEAKFPLLAEQFINSFESTKKINWNNNCPGFDLESSISGREASNQMIQFLSRNMPELWGGAADLSSSNKTMIAETENFQPNDYQGKNIWFGVREFGMAAAINGIALHGGSKVYGATFFVFVDYLRAALRLSAIQNLPVVYVLTHDSIAVGEDGPTHEPIEQLASLRCMPNVRLLRPADGNETVAAWRIAIETTDKPVVLVLSRQELKTVTTRGIESYDNVKKGGYIISKQVGETPEGILLATGSEVSLAIKAQSILRDSGHDVSVVSIPSFDLFEEQPEAYKDSVLPKNVKKRVSIEAGATFGWERYVGDYGKSVGIDRFGASAPGNLVMDKFGFTTENIVKTYLSMEVLTQ